MKACHLTVAGFFYFTIFVNLERPSTAFSILNPLTASSITSSIIACALGVEALLVSTDVTLLLADEITRDFA